MTRAEDLVKQASAAGLKPAIDFFVTPGSEQIRATLERDTTLSTFEEAGGIVLANACGKHSFLFFLNWTHLSLEGPIRIDRTVPAPRKDSPSDGALGT